MQGNGRLLFAGILTLAAAWALIETAGWPIKTALYPRAVTIPLLLLGIAETTLILRRKEEPETGDVIDVAFSTDVPADVAGRRVAFTAAWLGGFLLGAYLIGFPRAIPIFVFAYLKGQGKERWIPSLLLAAVAWLLFWLLFVRLLHLPFADGLLWRALFK